MRTEKRPVIGDVAREAAVSVATVSRALRDDRRVADSTRIRVREAADRLGYVIDPHASRLRGGRHRTIGLVAPRLHWYLSRVVLGVERVLHNAGYDLSLVAIETPKRRSDFVEAARTFARRVDGILLIDLPMIDGGESSLAELTNPLLTVGMTVPRCPSITIDNGRAAGDAIAHLTDLGHRRIGLIAVEGADNGLTPISGTERSLGYQLALSSAGIDFDPALVVNGDWSAASGQEAFRRFSMLDDPPSAIFAMSDEMAFGVMEAARAVGVSVPEELSIVGFDDHELSAVFGLTTMQQSVDKLGEYAAGLLLELLNDPGREPVAIDWPVELVARSSTARAPRS